MNFQEVLELHNIFSHFHATNSIYPEKISIYTAQSGGTNNYILCIKTQVNQLFSSFLEEVTENRRLGIQLFHGYIIIHSSGVWMMAEN
jgi:hypothetical protein